MERAVQGVSAAPGVAFGVAVVLDRPRPLARTAVAPAARGREVDRANAALLAAAHELQGIATRLREKGRDAEAEIVETGELMAGDPALIERVQSLIVESGLPADAALGRAADQIATDLANLADPTLALRARACDSRQGCRSGRRRRHRACGDRGSVAWDAHGRGARRRCARRRRRGRGGAGRGCRRAHPPARPGSGRGRASDDRAPAHRQEECGRQPPGAG
ncbi:MAG: hypothetical protein E6I23_11375 [Chloroflexi bacterium]|nr:MAG: hypothetical protein E6I23_11375 [Chloroflexota bacterium]